MSLVGTRPPTVDEWEKYELHHRSRMSIKPGITGMWQVSGRSDITDFEEVVKLDTEYIEKANGDGCMDESKFEGVTEINDHEFEFHNAHCFKINIPQIGPAQAIYYDVAALKVCCEHIKKKHIPHPIVYIMACRIGPFARHFYKEIHKLGGTVYLNPDGHEWMRAKWSAPIRKYWKISEQISEAGC